MPFSMRGWAAFASVVSTAGALAGYLGDYGPNGPGFGILIGILAAMVLPFVLFLGAGRPEPTAEEREHERQRTIEAQKARQRSRRRYGDRRVFFITTSLVGYLAGAAWHGTFAYDAWFTWIAGADWCFVVSLIFLSDPDEPFVI